MYDSGVTYLTPIQKAALVAFSNLSTLFQRDKGTVIPVPAVTPRRYLSRKACR